MNNIISRHSAPVLSTPHCCYHKMIDFPLNTQNYLLSSKWPSICIAFCQKKLIKRFPENNSSESIYCLPSALSFPPDLIAMDHKILECSNFHISSDLEFARKCLFQNFQQFFIFFVGRALSLPSHEFCQIKDVFENYDQLHNRFIKRD